MNNRILTLAITIFVALGFKAFSQNVGINTDGSAPDGSAILHIKSTDKGILIPSLTAEEISLIGAVATGLMVFNESIGDFQFYNGSNWIVVGTYGMASLSAPQTLTNKTINANNNTIYNIGNSEITLGAGIDASKIGDGSVSNTHFQRLNSIGSTVVGVSDTQTLSNKTLIDNNTYIADNTDNSKKLQFQVSGVTTSTTRTLTVPDGNTTIVGTDLSQTLTNKTIDVENNTITGLTKTDVGLGNVQNTLANYSANSAPTIFNDTTDGYSVGSIWIDTTNENAYICVENSVGAAIWKIITP